jgi:hypothetical protein
MGVLVGIAVFVVLLAVVAGGKLLWSRRRPKPKLCRDCVNWDWDAGQKALSSSPTFRSVMQHVTPNQEFGEKVFDTRDITDVDGNVTQQRYVKTRLPVYPPFEDRWEYFGGCQELGVLRHRTDTCPKFQRRVL